MTDGGNATEPGGSEQGQGQAQGGKDGSAWGSGLSFPRPPAALARTPLFECSQTPAPPCHPAAGGNLSPTPTPPFFSSTATVLIQATFVTTVTMMSLAVSLTDGGDQWSVSYVDLAGSHGVPGGVAPRRAPFSGAVLR